MKKLTLLLLLAPSIAYADSAGASLEILPSGNITGGVGGFTGSSSAKTAIGFGVRADHAIDPLITVGFAPRFFFGVNTSNGNGGSDHPHGLAIGLGAGVSYDVSPTLRGFFELGYQWGFQGGTVTVFNTTNSYKFETDYFGMAIGIAGVTR